MSLALNAEQEAAVSAAIESPDPKVCQILVAAGAGTGKTRCLTARAERLLDAGERPHSLAAMTFTNRAANEMKERLGDRGRGMQIGTFHSTAAALLRQGPNPDFAIIDEDEAADLLAKSAVRATPENRGGLATLKKTEAREWLDRISAWRAEGNTGPFSESEEAGEKVILSGRGGRPPFFETTLGRIVEEYEGELLRSNLKDYDRLIVEAVLRLEQEAQAGPQGKHRYHEILVDEAQDTDTLQKRMVYAMRKRPGLFDPACEEGARLFFVGDDDQLIYSWRNARKGFFQETGAMKSSRIFRLTENYRSTPQILKTANAAIECNEERIGKTLRAFPGAETGPIPKTLESGSATEEGNLVAGIIQRSLDQGGSGSDWAILSRTAMSFKMAEIALRKRDIPHRITAGRRLAQYKEVADLNALLRFSGNPEDDPAFERCALNLCKGAGPKTLESLAGNGLPLAEAAEQMGNRNLKPLLEVSQLIRTCCEFEGLAAATHKAAEWVAAHSIQGDDPKEAMQRERLSQVVEASTGIEAENPEASLREITSLLTLAPAGQEPGSPGEEEGDPVTLGTIHSAKGREWDHVILIAFEEAILPSWSALQSGDLEEERRLLHVATSRARKTLWISWALHRNSRESSPSQFLEEIESTTRSGFRRNR